VNNLAPNDVAALDDLKNLRNKYSKFKAQFEACEHKESDTANLLISQLTEITDNL